MTTTWPPVGRTAFLAHVRAQLAAGRSVVLRGPAGIGKSTLLNMVADPREPTVVLRSASAEAETELPYLALVDLFDGVPAEAFDTLAPHLRAALDGALLRGALPATPYDQLAVRLAVLEVLRVLAARGAVLLVLDDVQWIDEPSAGVLRFAARRLEDAQVQLLAAERVDDGCAGTRAALFPQPLSELAVPPLPEPEVADLLRARFGGGIPRRDSHRVFLASGGNPLYAVELGRALRERTAPIAPMEPLPVPGRLRGLLSARIATLPPADHTILLLVAAAARPSQALLGRCGVIVDQSLASVRAGVIAVDSDGAIRFSHPLLREMVYADAPVADRRAAHDRLASVVTDPVERARHLAAATDKPDESLAQSLADAAGAARLRGAPASAADLAQLAAERTPTVDPATAAVRWLEAARYAFAAGSLDDASGHATTALRLATDRRTRVGARLLLVEMAGEDYSGTGPLLDAAFSEATGDCDQLARVRLYRAAKAYYDADIEAALAELGRAEDAAGRCADAERLVEVLTLRGAMTVGAERDVLLERAGELATQLPLTSAVVAARQLAAMGRLFRGDVAEAVRRITALRAEVEHSGAVREIAAVLVSVAGVYGRAGRCADALAAGTACVRLYVDVMSNPGPGLLVCAMAELNGGTLPRAAEYAQRATVACHAAGDEGWIRHAAVTSGMIYLRSGDPVAAVETMRPAYRSEQQLGRADPGQLLWHEDFIEALVAVGARDEAASVLTEVTGYVERLDRPIALLGLARVGALLTAADGHARAAAQALEHAVEAWADHPYPLEIARAFHTLGGLERRAHRRGAARAALAEAVRRYAEARAVPWHDAAAAELAKVDGGRGAGLSETERRIVELVRAGATNREIGRVMFLSVKAVEANLTRLYRRLNVHNRAQLSKVLDPRNL